MNQSGGARVLCAFTVGLLSVSTQPRPVRAQGSPPVDADEVTNYPYLLHHGFGTYSVGAQKFRLVALPARVAIRSFANDRLGLRLRLTAYFGVQQPTALSLDQIRVAALVPGIEFQIPVRDNITLRPFQDIGIAKDGEGGDLVPLSTTGLLTEFVFPWKRFEFSLEPEVKYSFGFATERKFDDSFGVVTFKLDVRHPLWFEIGDRVPHVGAYVQTGFYFDELEFPRMDAEPLMVDRQHGFGLSFGVSPPIRLWFLRIRRLTVGYHYGQGLSGFRISFSDRLTQLPAR